MTAKKLIDISHVLEDGMITYKGLPAPVICDFLSPDQGFKFFAVPVKVRAFGTFPVRTFVVLD